VFGQLDDPELLRAAAATAPRPPSGRPQPLVLLNIGR